MPSQRDVRASTGNHRKQPLRHVQRQYRHERGLTASQVDLRAARQHEISTHTAIQAGLQNNLLNMIATADNNQHMDEDDEEEYHHTIDAIYTSSNVSQHLQQDLLQQEQLHFYIHSNDEMNLNEFAPPGVCSLNEWDDRKACVWIGFLVHQLE